MCLLFVGYDCASLEIIRVNTIETKQTEQLARYSIGLEVSIDVSDAPGCLGGSIIDIIALVE